VGEVNYVVVAAPSGAELTEIDNPNTITADGKTYYVSNHTYYERIQRDGKYIYVVVDPPLLVEVTDIPEDTVEILVNGKTYYQYDKIFYEEVNIPGKTIYKIVESPY
jgi:YHS domain-containing protein